MNISNKLTLFRILLVPAIVLILVCPLAYKYCVAFFLFLVASYTDYLDGKLARKNGFITNFGKIMDPLADKILVASIFICFVDLKLVPIIPVIIIVMREFIITSIRLLILENNKTIVPANIFGKLKTVVQMFAIVAVFYFEIFKEIGLNLSIAQFQTYMQNILIWLAAILSIISGIIYVVQNKKYISVN